MGPKIQHKPCITFLSVCPLCSKAGWGGTCIRHWANCTITVVPANRDSLALDSSQWQYVHRSWGEGVFTGNEDKDWV